LIVFTFSFSPSTSFGDLPILVIIFHGTTTQPPLAADACLLLLNTQVRRLLTGELLHILDHDGMFTSMVAVPGQRGLLVTGAENGQVEVWDVVAGEQNPTFILA
jgi:hypothetical protein